MMRLDADTTSHLQNNASQLGSQAACHKAALGVWSLPSRQPCHSLQDRLCVGLLRQPGLRTRCQLGQQAARRLLLPCCAVCNTLT